MSAMQAELNTGYRARKARPAGTFNACESSYSGTAKLPSRSQSLTTLVRRTCESFTLKSDLVEIQKPDVQILAKEVIKHRKNAWDFSGPFHFNGDKRSTAAYVIILGTVNFGSGFSESLNRTPEHSTYYTISSFLKKLFEEEGAPTPDRLREFTPEFCAKLFSQDRRSTHVRLLMEYFAHAFSELASFLDKKYGGDYLALIDDSNGSVDRLISRLVAMPMYRDAWQSTKYGKVAFLKRAQLLAADLARIGRTHDWWEFSDVDNLTLFADNAVAQVLRILGALKLHPDLERKINSGAYLTVGSDEELSIRAGSVYTGCQILNDLQKVDPSLTILELDYYLWHISHESKYRNSKLKRHMVRTWAY